MISLLVGAGKTYTTIQAALNALPSNFSGQLYEIVIDPGIYNELLTIPTITASSSGYVSTTNYLTIRPTAGAETKGVFDSTSTVKVNPSVAGTALTCGGSTNCPMIVKDIQFTSNTTFGYPTVYVSAINMTLENVLVKSRNQWYGFSFNAFGKAFKCIAWQTGTRGTTGFSPPNSVGIQFYNCGVCGFSGFSGYGLSNASNSFINCWYISGPQSGSATDNFYACNSGSKNNATSTSTILTASSLANVSNSQFNFVDLTNGNFRLNESSVLVGAGFNLSSSFTTDIDAQLISVWMIGPDFFLNELILDKNKTEIIYPVVPIAQANKAVFRLDSEEARVTQQSSALTMREIDTMRFRVDSSYLPAFLGNLYTNKTSQFRLSTPGYTPFGGTSEDNYVRILTHGRPHREDRGLTQTIDVTFRFMASYP